MKFKAQKKNLIETISNAGNITSARSVSNFGHIVQIEATENNVSIKAINAGMTIEIPFLAMRVSTGAGLATRMWVSAN